MTFTWTLLLSAAVSADFPPPKNLDFRLPTLEHWQGRGFDQAQLKGSSAVSSREYKGRDEPALLYQTFKLPHDAGTIHFYAHSVTRSGAETRRLDVFLEAAERRVVPKHVIVDGVLEVVTAISSSKKDKLREYVWRVAPLAGQTVRIVIVDLDPGPNRYVACSGFRIRAKDELNKELFGSEIDQLVRKHRLDRLKETVSDNFYVLSNAEADFTKAQIKRCEWLHHEFLAHFRSRGFDVRRPSEKLRAAIFRSQKGYEACLGAPVGSFITGVYHTKKDRLVVYDFGRNRDLVARREKMRERITKARTELERRMLGAALSQQMDNVRFAVNVSTLMHEVAHQMSYNCGLLNRNGDAPLWLIEGLACYCEASQNGRWIGIGKKSDFRVQALTNALAGRSQMVPLKELLKDDTWFRGRKAAQYAASGYAQSWALFRMLIEEQPRSLRKYLELIYSRRTSDHRLTDFAEIFGADLDRMERRHLAYLKNLVKD